MHYADSTNLMVKLTRRRSYRTGVRHAAAEDVLRLRVLRQELAENGDSRPSEG